MNHSSPDRNPDSLLRLFVVISIVSIIVVLGLSYYGIYGVYSRHVISGAEEDSINISKALAQENLLLLTTDEAGKPAISLADEDISGLDGRLRVFLQPFGIVKIKIYSLEKEIIYSTERVLIGQIDTENTRLDKVFNGYTDAHLERKESIRDLAYEQVLDVDVVETYVPIKVDNGDIVGSFEVYMDVTKYREEIQTGVITSITLLATILMLVFTPALFILIKATRELKAAEDKLTKLATIDALTGLCNRREIFSRARKEAERATRSNKKNQPVSLSFIMIDIDRFKSVNDTYGHQVGDAVLRELANRLEVNLRKYDTVGRYGGEEFLVVLPGCNLNEAQMVAERTRHAVRDKPFTIGNLSLDVTISLGISHADGNGDEELKSIIKRADDGLYKAKNEGRDRVALVNEAIEAVASIA